MRTRAGREPTTRFVTGYEDIHPEEGRVDKAFRPDSTRGIQYVNVTIRSSPTASMWYAVSGNFAGASRGWPVMRSHEPLQSLQRIVRVSGSTSPSVRIAHLHEHAYSTAKKRTPARPHTQPRRLVAQRLSS